MERIIGQKLKGGNKLYIILVPISDGSYVALQSTGHFRSLAGYTLLGYRVWS